MVALGGGGLFLMSECPCNTQSGEPAREAPSYKHQPDTPTVSAHTSQDFLHFYRITADTDTSPEFGIRTHPQSSESFHVLASPALASSLPPRHSPLTPPPPLRRSIQLTLLLEGFL